MTDFVEVHVGFRCNKGGDYGAAYISIFERQVLMCYSCTLVQIFLVSNNAAEDLWQNIDEFNITKRFFFFFVGWMSSRRDVCQFYT